MGSDDLYCWRCGAPVLLSLPLGRLDECGSCGAQLHVCRLCGHYAAQMPTGCDEQGADEVRVKDRANFCDWFSPRMGVFSGEVAAADRAARDRLAALFGGPESSADKNDKEDKEDADPLQRAADALFRKTER